MSKSEKRWRLPLGILVILLVVIGLVKHFHIKNFNVVVPGVLYTSGQPRGMDYSRLLYKYHIGSIVNVRSPSEHRGHNWYNEEITWIRENAVKYFELPIEQQKQGGRFPDSQTQIKFLEIMAEPGNLPVLIHGGSGRNRESTLAAVWLVGSEGYSVDEAVKVVEKIEGRVVTGPEKKFLESL